jgi:hypothetical protein
MAFNELRDIVRELLELRHKVNSSGLPVSHQDYLKGQALLEKLVIIVAYYTDEN